MGVVVGLAEVSWQAGHRGEEKEEREREEQACELCDDYHKTQGPSVLRPAQAGRHRAGSPSRCAGRGKTQEKREEGQRDSQGDGNSRSEREKKRQIGERQR